MRLWRGLVETADEHSAEISSSILPNFISLCSTKQNQPLDSALLVEFEEEKADEESPDVKKRKVDDDSSQAPKGSSALWIRGSIACGILISKLGLPSCNEALTSMLLSTSSTSRVCACLIVSEYFKAGGEAVLASSALLPALESNLQALTTNLEETAFLRNSLDSQSQRLVQDLKQLPALPPGAKESLSKVVFPVMPASAHQLATAICDAVDFAGSCTLIRDAVLATLGRLDLECRLLQSTINSCAAEAIIYSKALPAKLQPILKPLVSAIKKQSSPVFQDRAASAMAQIILLCSSRQVSPNSKLIRTLMTSVVVLKSEVNSESEVGEWPALSASRRIQVRGCESALRSILQLFAGEALDRLPVLWSLSSTRLLTIYGSDTATILTNTFPQHDQSTINGLFAELQLVRLLLRHGDPHVRPRLRELLAGVFGCVKQSDALLRRVAALVTTDFCNTDTVTALEAIIRTILPMLSDMDDDNSRIGAVSVLLPLLSSYGVSVGAYLSFLVVPVLGRMSDPLPEVRHQASLCFARAVRLMPLEAGIPNPEGMDAELVLQRVEKRKFLEQLLDGSKIHDYAVTPRIKAELRRYQQDGVNWLAFLQKFNLHGVLCDDMGLGKTLQTICVVATDTETRRINFQKSSLPEFKALPSLVVCPSTLVHHWEYEVEKFCERSLLQCFAYSGDPSERALLRKKILPILADSVIVMSYQVLRSDLKFFGDLHWNWCVLDEGHVIKNHKSQLAVAVKKVHANHRLVLSGTPIQNNVLDLWSLFDFLMPGYMGEHSFFQSSFSKPIASGNSAKASEKDQEKGTLALEALHRQALPFLMRRLKEDVLHDLPPKIIQDYYCQLCPLQLRLYDSFSKSQVKKETADVIDNSEAAAPAAMHVFQSLHYLRKLCTHPALVLNATHPDYASVTQELQASNSNIRDIKYSPKLIALRQLLLDCGIGVCSFDKETPSDAVGQHRVLVFAQLKDVLDLVEHDLFKTLMPTVTYLRMDGAASSAERFQIVHRFNEDPTIDVLLLTTHVGGLGLNLTGADTVIFLEHDWNPMKDLQAMDRAHRIGQKKVVNVYRLITRDTLEEKIMSLQKFKLNVANTVVTQDNSSLQSMGTGSVLDLLTVSSDRETKQESDRKASVETVDALGNAVVKGKAKEGSARHVLENLQQLWDESQYEEEYDMKNFVQKLKR